jgi:hypothetical protein
MRATLTGICYETGLVPLGMHLILPQIDIVFMVPSLAVTIITQKKQTLRTVVEKFRKTHAL